MSLTESDLAATKSRAPNRPSRWRIGFWSLVVTQFQGAFNDNALKFLVIYLVVDMGLPDHQRDWLVLVVGALFAVPFILFSMSGGYLADRFSKRSVTIGTKWMEVCVMIFSLAALAQGSLALEAVAVFLMSSQGALFGPSKYGLLPELLPERDLSWGNGIIELGTFLAAISATVASGFLAFYFRGRQIWSGTILLCCTFLGLAASFGISRVPAANPFRQFNANPLGDLFAQLRQIRSDRILAWAFVGNLYLWFLAALLQFTIVIYGHDILRIDDRHISYLQAAVAVGIGVGSLAAGYLSFGKIEYGLIPLGAVGMTVFGFLSAESHLSLLRVAIYLGLLGFFGGFYAVPLNALIQHRPDPAHKGGIIAAANLVSFVGVFLAAGVYFLLATGLNLGADRIFFAGACMTLAATLYAVLLLPDSLARLGLWLLTHTLYQLEITGREFLPDRGNALLLAGNLSRVEKLLLAASTDRPIRFLTGNHRSPVPGTAQSATTAVASPTSGLGRFLALTLSRGEFACIAGENALPLIDERTETGVTLRQVLAEARAPIVPVTLEGTPNGPLRDESGRLRWHVPARLPCRAIVRVAPPLAPVASLDLRRAIEDARALGK